METNSTVTFSNTSFTGCKADYGGAICINVADGTILTFDRQCRFINCSSSDRGGAMYL
jgi:hypothetical protein